MKADIKYILFDVAGTLLHKPMFYQLFLEILNKNGYKITLLDLKLKHKIASEIIQFPDRTNKEFYSDFNRKLLFSLGIIPNEKLLEEIFSKCSYLPWEKFQDTEILSSLNVPIGIISNFNSTLKDKLNEFFGNIFKNIIVSEEVGFSKPSIDFYKIAIEQIGILPQNILYIGDSLRLDIEPALLIGMNPLLIDRDGFYPNSNYHIQDLNQILNYI
jgi:putative hydrolase of the HAD superfamily